MKSLRETITEYIMQKIDSGEWPVGYKLPSEMQLCEMFHVSRLTVRTAVLQLVNDGHLHRIKGNGTYVIKPKHLENTTVFVESFAEAKTGKKVKSEVLELRECRPDENICRLLGSDEMAIKLTRLRYIDGSPDQGPIVLTTSYFPRKLSFILNADFEKSYMHTVLSEHGIMRNSIQKELIPVQLNPGQMLLTSSRESSLGMLVQSVDKDEEGNIVCVTQSFYPVGRNHFVLTYTV